MHVRACLASGLFSATRAQGNEDLFVPPLLQKREQGDRARGVGTISATSPVLGGGGGADKLKISFLHQNIFYIFLFFVLFSFNTRTNCRCVRLDRSANAAGVCVSAREQARSFGEKDELLARSRSGRDTRLVV